MDVHDQVSTFSPDGGLFAYYYKGVSGEYVAICNALTGEELGRVPMPAWDITQIIWLTPEKLVCRGKNDRVFLIGKAKNKWSGQPFDLARVNSSCLAALSGDTFAWADARGIFKVNTVSNNTLTQMFEGPGSGGMRAKTAYSSLGGGLNNSYRIVLDTTVGNASGGWTMAFCENGIKLRQDAFSSNPPIHYVGVGALGALGHYLNFSLTDVYFKETNTVSIQVTNMVSFQVTNTASFRVTNTIYHDTFRRKGPLNGSTPRPVDAGKATWSAWRQLTTDGSEIAVTNARPAGGFNNAFLPFTPATGHVYTLSVDIKGTYEDGSWLAFGYALNATTTNYYAAANCGVGWLLQRPNNISLVYGPRSRPVTEFDYSQTGDQFLVTCREKTGFSLWRLNLNTNAADKFTQLTDDSDLHKARWLNGGGGYAYLNGKKLVVKADAASKRVCLGDTRMEDFSVAPNGHDLLFFGIVSNAPSAGLWRYDTADATLANIVPWSDHATGQETSPQPLRCFLQTGPHQSISYYVFQPAHFDRHKKYPMVIADTPYAHFEDNYIQGRTWPAISLATCGAYVVIVDRRAWFEDIQNWGKNLMAVYSHLVSDPAIDSDNVYLYGVSAETSYMSQLVEQKPELWKGALFLNPTVLPDFSAIKSSTRLPKVLISAGANEGESERFKKFQNDACGRGIAVTVQELADTGHFEISTAASRARMYAMVNFVFNQ